MNGRHSPTSRRFVRAAWTLLAFQLVAAAGAAGLAIWAASEVQRVIDERDSLALRMREIEARRPPPAPLVEEPLAEPDPEPEPKAELPVRQPAQTRPTRPAPRPPVDDRTQPDVVYEPAPPPVVIDKPEPDRPRPRPRPPAIRPDRLPTITVPPSRPPTTRPQRDPQAPQGATPPGTRPPATITPPRITRPATTARPDAATPVRTPVRRRRPPPESNEVQPR